MRARRAKQAMPETSAMQNNAGIIFCSRYIERTMGAINKELYNHEENT
ncbi:MAG TPA: hypothetical protein PLN69_11800 [bacterium]|nr:hypothetical protein [bacterium]